jgi:ABC-type transporter MlaC component
MGRIARLSKAAACLPLALASVLVFASGAQAQTTIDAFVAKVSDGLKTIPAQAGGDNAKTITGCRDFMSGLLNLQAMAQAASGDAWQHMSATQRTDYQDAFAQHLATECARELAGYKDEAITLAGVRTTPDGDKLATLRLGAPANARMIAWRLRGHDAAYAAVDVIFEGHSAVVEAHDQFTVIMRATHGDVDAVIKALKAARK